VTAITTAGLLAGLFGSAFVPSALARNSTTAPRVAATELLIANLGSIENMEMELNDKYTKVNTLRIGSYANGHKSQQSGPRPYNDTEVRLEDYSLGFFLKDTAFNPLDVADLSATVTGSSVVVAWAYAGDDADGVIRCDADKHENNIDNDGAGGDTDTTGQGYDLEGVFGTTDAVNGAPGLNTYWQDEENRSVDYLDAANTKANFAEGAEDMDSSEGDFDGLYWLCIKAKGSTKGISTIKVSANGVQVASVSVQVVGDLQTLELSSTYPRIALDNGFIRNGMKLVAKDSAGQVLNAKYDGYYGNLEDIFNTGVVEKGSDDSDVTTHANGDDINWVTYGDEVDDGSAADAVSINSGTCASDSFDSDKGGKFDLGVEAFNWSDNLVQSNDVEITCTGSSDEGVISSITAQYTVGEADWAASAVGVAATGHVFKVTGVVKDQSGGLMGRDNTTGYDPGAYTIDGDTLGLTAELGIDETMTSTVVGVDGKVTIGTLVPDMGSLAKFRYTVVVTDANQGVALAQKLTTELFYTALSGIELDYSLSRVRNAAKTVATWTADYGVACSNARIEFNWENADGSKFGTVERRANINGVAKFSMARRNQTIFVYAAGCVNYSAETDFVKARFR
jgi:hypothetical protein